VYVFRRGIYVQAPGAPLAVRTFAVARGTRPVSLAVGRDGVIVFGEYWPNTRRSAVHIYASADSGTSWRPVYTFREGAIRHVHGISYDPWEDCFWICTGDNEAESLLLRASADFRNVTIVRKEAQSNRFFSLLVLEDRLLAATDIPHGQNHICAIEK